MRLHAGVLGLLGCVLVDLLLNFETMTLPLLRLGFLGAGALFLLIMHVSLGGSLLCLLPCFALN